MVDCTKPMHFNDLYYLHRIKEQWIWKGSITPLSSTPCSNQESKSVYLTDGWSNFLLNVSSVRLLITSQNLEEKSVIK